MIELYFVENMHFLKFYQVPMVLMYSCLCVPADWVCKTTLKIYGDLHIYIAYLCLLWIEVIPYYSGTSIK
jgi:hypothetical protein